MKKKIVIIYVKSTRIHFLEYTFFKSEKKWKIVLKKMKTRFALANFIDPNFASTGTISIGKRATSTVCSKFHTINALASEYSTKSTRIDSTALL